MTKNTITDAWLAKVVELLCAIDGVTCDGPSEKRLALEILHDGKSCRIDMAIDSGDYRVQKIQYERVRETLAGLGIEEGAIYKPPPPPRRGMTPQIRAAREKQKLDFEAWQDVWRAVRQAEKALDVEYEIAQMKDYY